MSPKYRRQNRNVCDLVLIFSQNQRLFFLEVKLYRSPSFQVLWSLPWQDQAVFNFLGRFQGHMVCGCWQALNHASIALVTKYRQLAHLNTTFNDEKFFLIAIKILRLKRSLGWGHNLRKRIVLVLLTAVDLRRSIMCAAWPDNICLESTSLPPKGFQEVLLISITIFISSYLHSFFTNTSFSKISVTLDQDYLRPCITWQKERACNVLISEFPAPSPAIYIYSKQFSAV